MFSRRPSFGGLGREYVRGFFPTTLGNNFNSYAFALLLAFYLFNWIGKKDFKSSLWIFA
jgi:hypothetical protein